MTPYLCPDCRRELDPAELSCAEGHRFEEEDGVLVLLSRELAPRLDAFLEVVRDYRSREDKRILDEAAYERLPWGEAERGSFEWQVRCHDLEILRELLAGRNRARVLDVGSYNGWLARDLSTAGHRVTAIDYFSDPYDGLGARRFYRRPQWRSIQLDLRDLSLLNRTYEVVVLNRCLQFFGDPTAYLDHVKTRVAPGGLVIATGLDLFRDPRRKLRAVAHRQAEFRERYGRDFFLHPTRGYLDLGDRRRLQAAGLEIRPYPQLRWVNLLSILRPTRPRFCYGVWEHPGGG